MPRRIAFVVNALAGNELSGGRHDAARMFALLTRANLGACESTSPAPIHDCPDRQTFMGCLLQCLHGWNSDDQLVLYYSGHGSIRNDKYILHFGENSILPFDSLMSDLTAHGVVRAIVILDACQSGEVLKKGVKNLDTSFSSQELPRGIALLTSCRDREASYELPDNSASIFTHLLAEAIETGLGGTNTEDNRISVQDAMQYISEKLRSTEYEKYPQSPIFGIHGADRSIWLSNNIAQAPENETRATEELRLLYETTSPTRRPCIGCSIDDLDWELVEQYCQKIKIECSHDRRELARQLGFFSPIMPNNLSLATVLCFAKNPETFVPNARSVFIAGEHTTIDFVRIDVVGPLSRQLDKLVSLVERQIAVRGIDTRYCAPFMQTVREAISNAIVHRDYTQTGHTKVSFAYPMLSVSNPGAFANGASWDELIAAPGISSPTDAAVAWYLTSLLAAETIGRGFSIYRSYAEEFGDRCVLGKTIFQGAAPSIDVSIIFQNAGKTHDERMRLEDTIQPGSSDYSKLDGQLPTLIAGYRIVGELGRGGAGAVYLAEDTKLLRNVAIKTIFRRFGSTVQRERFLRESDIAQQLNHPGIVPTYARGVEEDYFYIVMKHIDGCRLDEYWAELSEPTTKADKIAATIVAKICRALAAAHNAGVVHRDIKPGNIMVEKDIPIIMDFGTAIHQQLEDASLTQTGELVGTPHYISPEQVRGIPVDQRTDIFAVGIIFYQLLTGVRPREGNSVLEVIARVSEPVQLPKREPRIPRELGKICLKALEVNPENRYSSAEDMALELESWLTKKHDGWRWGKLVEMFRRRDQS